MTDWLIAHLTPRNAVLGVALLFLVPIVALRIPWALRVVRHKAFPSRAQAATPPPDLKTQLARNELRGMLSRYRRVNAMLDRAEAQGLPVAGHRAKAKAALRLAQLGYRWKAQEVMNEVEMTVPRQKVRYIPVYPKEEGEDELIEPDARGTNAEAKAPPEPKAKPKAKAKTKPRGRRRR